MNFLKQDDLAKLLLRLAVGGLMLFHGIAKLGSTASMTFIKGTLVLKGMPAELAYGVFVGELLAPMLVLLGFQARIGGLIIAINMLFAIWLVHMGDLFALGDHGGWSLELQGFYLVGGLCILFLGSGKFAFKPD